MDKYVISKTKKIGLISLGCDKNRVDSEIMLTYLRNAGYRFTSDASNADIIIIGIPDRENPRDDSSWGEYVMEQVEKQCGVRPTIIFEGSEEARSHWYDTLDVEVKITDRNEDPISATMIRQMLLEDDKEGVADNIPCGMWGFYEDLRNIMLEVYQNEEVQN